MDKMFKRCSNLISVNTEGWNTSNVTTMYSIFMYCNNLTSIDISNWNTNSVTNMQYMFFNCNNLTSLDVRNFDTGNVTNMVSMFNNCANLTSLDVSSFNTSNVTNMSYMFAYCRNLTSLDVSNFDTSKVTDMQDMFINISKLSDIGMLYCTPSTINTISSNLPTTRTQTIWVKDTKPNECTVVSGVEFKEYKENSVMINLSSPLLDGDRIEVKDGKLCHYHKMGMVVLNGNESWKESGINYQLQNTTRFYFDPIPLCYRANYGTSKSKVESDMFITKVPKTTNSVKVDDDIECITVGSKEANNGHNIRIGISKSKLSTQDLNGFRQWLSENPTTVVYELEESYYEDITPIQSKLTLETYLECNMNIYTNLPIKTNLTYLTNIANTSSIEEEINAINEGTDLTNLLEDEINN